MTVRLSPVLTGLRTYPFVRLTDAKRRLAASGVDVIVFLSDGRISSEGTFAEVRRADAEFARLVELGELA